MRVKIKEKISSKSCWYHGYEGMIMRVNINPFLFDEFKVAAPSKKWIRVYDTELDQDIFVGDEVKFIIDKVIHTGHINSIEKGGSIIVHLEDEHKFYKSRWGKWELV